MSSPGRQPLSLAVLTLATTTLLAWAGVGCQSSNQLVHANARLTPGDDPLISIESAPAFPGLSEPVAFEPVEALVVPPLGWRQEPLKSSDRHNHQVWLSPSGNTAYGIIRFKMPFPVGPDLALRHGFLPELKKTQGEARLLSSQRDDRLPGLRFVAEGGLYRLRTNMMTRGWKGWAIYAGTLRAKDVDPAELELAELARERTVVGPLH